MRIPLVAASLLVALCLFVWPSPQASGPSGLEIAEPQAPTDTQPQLALAAAAMPSVFVPNVGQWDARCRFRARHRGQELWVEDAGWTLSLPCEGGSFAVRMTFEGAQQTAVRGTSPHELTIHSLRGRDHASWRTDIPTYNHVMLSGVKEGLDVRLRIHGESFEYDLEAAAGVDLDQVTVRCEGIDGLSVDAQGSLVIRTAAGEIRQAPPQTWQTLPDGQRQPVQCSFRLLGERRYGFSAPMWDSELPLTVDPGLSWSYVASGGGSEAFTCIAPGAAGYYVGGTTTSTDYPTTIGAFQPAAASFDGVIAWIIDGQLVAATHFGGSLSDQVTDIAYDSGSDEVLICGLTQSTDLPLPAGPTFQATNAGGTDDAFAARLDIALSSLVASTYLGGSSRELAPSCALSPLGELSVATSTLSADYPVTANAFDPSANGGYDVALTTLNPLMTAAVTSTYLGGSAADYATDVGFSPITLGPVVVGHTMSASFPTTALATQPAFGGSSDGFVTWFDGVSLGVVSSTFIGGLGIDRVEAVSDDGLLIAGRLGSVNFPTTPGAFSTTHLGFDGFAAIAVPDAPWAASTRLAMPGTPLSLEVHSVAWTLNGVVIAGAYSGTGFTPTSGAYDTTFGGGAGDGFVMLLDSTLSSLRYATWLGGADLDTIYDLSVAADGSIAAAGRTLSTAFPGRSSTTSGLDAFVTKLSMLPEGVSRYGASSGGGVIDVNQSPAAGSTSFAVEAWAPTAGPFPAGVLVVGLAPLPAGTSVLGTTLHIDLSMPTTTITVPAGSNAVSVPLTSVSPGDTLYVQFLWVDAQGTFHASDALEIVVQ